MSDARPHTVTPASYREFARVLGGAAGAGRKIRLQGGATKLHWGGVTASGSMHLSTARLTEASFTDSTATFGAGLSLAAAHAKLGRRGRLLAIDPPMRRPGNRYAPTAVQGVRPGAAPDGGGQGVHPSRARQDSNQGLRASIPQSSNGHSEATLGGVLATADSGPLSHGYGGVREQVLDLLMALSDGTLVRASEQAERDLCSLAVGSYGTLGAILEVTVKTQPLPERTATVMGTTASPGALTAAAIAVSDGPAPAAAIDYAWHRGVGGLLVMPLAATDEHLQTTVRLMHDASLLNVDARTDTDSLWARQRSGQRSADRAVLRLSCPRNRLPELLALADSVDATVVGRAASGTSYLTVDVDQIATVRQQLPEGFHCMITDLPAPARGVVDPWEPLDAANLSLMLAVKQRFDPLAACNPGVFVGGI